MLLDSGRRWPQPSYPSPAFPNPDNTPDPPPARTAFRFRAWPAKCSAAPAVALPAPPWPPPFRPTFRATPSARDLGADKIAALAQRFAGEADGIVVVMADIRTIGSDTADLSIAGPLSIYRLD